MYKPTVEEIKNLRETTFAPMMHCKQALVESEGDLKKALAWLNAKGLLKAASKSERAVGAGIIDSYIHNGSQIGVLLDIRSETDFVARNEEFKKLAHEICLQVAVSNPEWLSPETIPQEVIEEKRLTWEKELATSGKSKEMMEKILQGKFEAFYKEVCLLNQPYIKDESGKLTVAEFISQTIAKTGENIKINKFIRFAI